MKQASMFKPLVLIALLSGASLAAADTFTTLTLPVLNTDIRTYSDGATYAPLFPSVQTWSGVPFQFAASATGNTAFIDGVLDIPVGVFGVTSAYTIINSGFGAFGSNNGSVEFFGVGSYHKVDLIQGTNIRDHFDNVFNNVIDNVTAVPAFNGGPGRARLDQQIYELPASFATETLLSIRFTGLNLGAAGVPFITAATVAVAAPVPEPGSSWLLISGGLALLAWRRSVV
jgi:hypothetical protein